MKTLRERLLGAAAQCGHVDLQAVATQKKVDGSEFDSRVFLVCRNCGDYAELTRVEFERERLAQFKRGKNLEEERFKQLGVEA